MLNAAAHCPSYCNRYLGRTIRFCTKNDGCFPKNLVEALHCGLTH
jgi:hypothetical protein